MKIEVRSDTIEEAKAEEEHRVYQSSGWAGPAHAQPGPAHGPKIFETKTMGWAGPMRFFGGRPWAESFCPWFNCSIKNFLIHS